MKVIITGGSRGLGKAMALKFASAGYDLILCSKNNTHLVLAQQEIATLYPAIKVNIYPADLSVKEEVLQFGKYCLEVGVPDILINNAGSYIPGNCIDEAEGNMETMMNLHFYAAYYLTRFLLPTMIEKKSGHIFNMCSIASLQAYAGGGSYSVSKFALHGFSKNIRSELKPHGIKVTTVFPGAVFTDTWGDFDNSKGRIMEADDIANMVFASSQLSPQAVVEEIVLRPILGDL
jgi:short-subunit dehydrogenase